jgi:MYXO-CTERM domain-containing protein
VVIEHRGLDLAALEAVDSRIVVQVVRPGVVQAWVPHVSLLGVAALPGVRRVREPHWARPKTVVSEGLAPMFADVDWHGLGETGAGVVVAVVDVGFGGWRDLKGVELPVDVEVFQDEEESVGHGTAVAEIVHDVAPDAQLQLHSFQTDQEYMDLVEAILAAEEVDIINASIGFDNVWTLDGSSPFSQMVDYAVSLGVVYVAAAGNEADKYRMGAVVSDGEGGLVLAGESTVEVRAPSGQVEVSLRWSEPMDGADNDLDLRVVDADGVLCGESTDSQDGDDAPFEKVRCVLADGEVGFVQILEGDGPVEEGLTAWLYSPYGMPYGFSTPEQTLSLPADAAGAITVGSYLVETAEVVSYSSRGPTEDGRQKPDLVAATGVSTQSLGARLGEGTSYSAPHVAGAAALLLSRKPRLDPGEVKETLQTWALDIEDPGPDNTSGYGAVRMAEIPTGCGCSHRTGGNGGLPWILVALALGASASLRRL